MLNRGPAVAGPPQSRQGRYKTIEKCCAPIGRQQDRFGLEFHSQDGLTPARIQASGSPLPASFPVPHCWDVFPSAKRADRAILGTPPWRVHVDGSTWLEGPIVVPLDGREPSLRALPVAARASRSLDAPIRLMSVVDDEKDVETRKEWIASGAAQYLTGDQHRSQAEPDIVVEIAESIAESVAAEADTNGLVCMATAGKVRFHNGHFGSVAEGVARTLARPLLMVGPRVDLTSSAATQRVVVPVDGSQLADSACRFGADLAGALGAPLWIISVVSPSDVAFAASQQGGEVVSSETNHVHSLARRLRAAYDIDVQFEVLHAEAADRAIVNFVADDAMAVMCTHGRTGLKRLFSGSVTAGVVAHSHRAVAVFRPEGFD